MRAADRIRKRKSERKQERNIIKERTRKGLPLFLKYDILNELIDEPDEFDIELNDEESWGGEETAQDEPEAESPEFHVIADIRPLWLLYKGRIVWASDNLDRDIRERELFRRRVQAFLDFLAGEFPDKCDADRLLAMQGIFMMKKEGRKKQEEQDQAQGKNKSKKRSAASTAWLNRLDRVGIVYGNGKFMPLKNFRVKHGGSGSGGDSCPKHLILLWLERELKEHMYLKPGGCRQPLKNWKSCKDWIMGINDFLDLVNKNLNDLVSVDGIGLEKRNFKYEESTIQRKLLSTWRKWLEAERAESLNTGE